MEKIPKTPMGFSWYVTKPYLPWAFFAFLFATVAQVLGSASPYIFKQVIETAERVSAGESVAISVVTWALMYPLIIALSYIFWRGSGFVGLRWLTRSTAYGYNKLFEYLTLHSDTYFSNRFAGALANKISHASDGAEDTLSNIVWTWYPTFLQFLVAFGLMALSNVWIGLMFLAFTVILLAVNIALARRRRPFVVAYAEVASSLRGKAVDVAANIRAVHQFARRPFEVRLLGESVDKRRLADVKQWRMAEWVLVINSTFIILALSSIVFLLVTFWSREIISTGDLIMVLTVLSSVLGSLMRIGNMMNSFVRRYGQIEEGLSEVLIKHDLVDNVHAKPLTVSLGAVSFENVVFSYQDQDSERVFQNLTLSIPGHQKVGLVGASGAGKTTFVSLLLRQQDIESGSIKIDGQDIRDVTQESLRSAISVVPQEPMLFHRTIFENIQYGRIDATREEVIEAAKVAQAHEFIIAAPNGYDTYVGERGIKLSGGQRQRVVIARAILKNAPILVLDEATSSLDSESEVLIQKALHTLMEGKTVVAIAHRLSTLRAMDRIVVLDKGSLVQDGTHEELVRREGVYKRLWEHQAGGFLQE